ncbi:PAS domain S-box protein [Microvirga yunnanensis]|uniref:PAS domain S-box protein n=1 Tax=Microvirga yunnanensis TaxID=2953740 RepID=UPI0021C8B623|nr:PAS domain S-box protein [Microvirga sp. HBU65207]
MTVADNPNSPVTGVDDVLITAELERRPIRAPDYEAESRALGLLAQEMATHPGGVLGKCAELVLELCQADSAGIGLLEPGGEHGRLRWHAMAGALAGHVGGTIPWDVSPGGTAIARDSILLLQGAEQCSPALRDTAPRIYESLLVPWHSNGTAVGTLWAIKHTPEGQFDAEDARLLQSLARAAAAAYHMTDALDKARIRQKELERQVEERTRALAKAHESLRTSEARFRTALEIETVGAIYLDLEGRILDANDAFLAMGGYSREDLETERLTWQGLTPPEWMEASERAVAELKATGRTTPYEKEYFRKDGSRWCAVFAAKALPDGTIFEFVLDITARQQAEEALAAELRAMTRLHELSRQVVRSADLEAMLNAILDATIELHGADFGNIQLYDEATQTLHIAVQRGFQQQFIDHFAEVTVKEGSACGMALARCERVVIEDVEQEPAYAPSLPAAREAGYRAVQSTPLFTPKGKPLGMLSTHFRQPHRMSERELRLTDIYARQASDAIAAQVLTQSLQESEERFRSLVESWAQAVWETDAEGLVTADSPSWRTYTGQTREEYLGAGWTNAIHPDDRVTVERLWCEAVRERRPVNAEYRLRRAGGGWRWTNDRAAPLLAPDGTVRKWVGMNIDITERKEAEEALRASEERFRYVARATRDIIWDIDLVTDRVWESEALQTQMGYAPEDIGPDTAWCLAHIHPDDRERVVQDFKQAAEGTGRHWSDEYRYRRADGSYADIVYRGFILRDAQGQAMRMIGAMQDISVRKQAEEALRASESRARLLLGELQHRVRNTLSVIRSIVKRTAQTSPSVEDYAMHLDGRLNAFARVQTAVARDPAAGLDLTDLVADELLTYAAHEGEQVRMAGPSVRLQPKAAETFGLAIHELATNAVKYGALSVPHGRILISWRVHNSTEVPRLVLEWKESGLADRVAKRKRRGFGTDLLERTLTYELKAKTVQTFESDGLRCTIELPLTKRIVIDHAASTPEPD